jgi:hypothetical protein
MLVAWRKNRFGGRDRVTFVIHASKEGRSAETQRIRGFAAAAKARDLADAGWDVYVTDAEGRRFALDELDGLTDGKPPPSRLPDQTGFD